MTRTRVAVTGDGRVELDGDVVRARRLPDEDGRTRVALVASQALLLAGDDVRIEVEVGPGRALEVVEVSGTVAYDMRGGAATWTVDVRVAPDGVLVWAGLPFVVADGADVERRTRIGLAPGARAVLRETLVLGRTGEAGGRVRTTTDARLAGRPLLVETFVVEPATVRDPALLGGARCLDNVLVLGARLDHPDALQLDGPGTLVRGLSTHAHAADLGDAVRAAVAGLSGVAPSAGVHRTAAGTPGHRSPSGAAPSGPRTARPTGPGPWREARGR